MPNRFSLRLDISTKKSSFHTVYWWGTHSAKRCCVEPLLPPSDHLKKSRDIEVETRETWHPTVTWTEVYTDVFQKSCDTSRGPHALWHITWDSCNTRTFYCLRIRWKKSERYAGLSLWRWCRWWITWAFTGVIQRHVLNLESMGQATSSSTYKFTTDRLPQPLFQVVAQQVASSFEEIRSFLSGKSVKYWKQSLWHLTILIR